LIFLPILFALLLYILDNPKANRLSPAVILVEIGLAAYLFYDVIANGQRTIQLGGYQPHVGIELLVDPLMAAFVLLGPILWLFSYYYAITKWSEDAKFHFFFHFLRGTYYAFIFSNDLFNIFVLVELISLLSAVLITYKKDGFSIRAGFYYLLFNSVGMVFYLLGVMIIYQQTGSLNLTHMAAMPPGPMLKFALALMVVAFGVKSAFFPVYNWLPKAHAAAPTSISMLLSGLLVKAGFVGLIKVFRVLGSQGFTRYMLVIGVLTAVIGFLFAVSQKDIKLILAFHTISQSGLILIGLAGEGPVFVGGLLHLFNHALFKSELFLVAGVLIGAYNTRRVDEIRGLFQTMPGMGVMMALAMLSITAFPYTNGYVSKALIAKGSYGAAMTYALHVINFGTILSFFKVSTIFQRDTFHQKPMPVPRNKKIAIYGLGVVLLFSAFVETFFLKYFAPGTYVTITPMSFVNFAIYLAGAILFYRLFIKKEHPWIAWLRHFKLTFADANILMMIFLITAVFFSQN
jgi:multicomponent Na+:H+ antiporter subunit D